MSKPLSLDDEEDDLPALAPRPSTNRGAILAARVFNIIKWAFVGIAVVFAGTAIIYFFKGMAIERIESFDSLALFNCGGFCVRVAHTRIDMPAHRDISAARGAMGLEEGYLFTVR